PTPARVRLRVSANVGPLPGADCEVDSKISRLRIARLNVALLLKIRPDSVLDARRNQRIQRSLQTDMLPSHDRERVIAAKGRGSVIVAPSLQLSCTTRQQTESDYQTVPTVCGSNSLTRHFDSPWHPKGS